MSERPPSGFAIHAAREKALNASLAANQAVEDRRLTPEVQQLNDVAQVEIWGTRGRTAGFIDPNTGNPLSAPIPGVLSEIRQNRRFGTTEEERETVANDYEEQVEGLLDKDFELCQAKLIMDLRTEDEESSAKMIAKQIHGGLSAEEAQDKVLTIYAKKDAKRLEKIKREGIFTRDEYEGNLGDSHGPEDRTKELAQQKEREQLRQLAHERDLARDDFARRLAGRSSRIFFFGRAKTEFSETAVAKARHDFNQARLRLLSAELEPLRRANPGMTPKNDPTLRRMLEVAAAVDEMRLAKEIRNQEKIASGAWRARADDENNLVTDEDGVSVLEKVRGQNPLTRSVAAFRDFWGRTSSERNEDDDSQSLIKSRLKKAGLLAAGGLGVVAPTAKFSSLLLGPVIGAGAGLITSRLTRGLWRDQVYRYSNGKAADRRWSKHIEDRATIIRQGGGRPMQQSRNLKFKRVSVPMEDFTVYATRRAEKDVTKKREVMVGTMAVGAALGHILQ